MSHTGSKPIESSKEMSGGKRDRDNHRGHGSHNHMQGADNTCRREYSGLSGYFDWVALWLPIQTVKELPTKL